MATCSQPWIKHWLDSIYCPLLLWLSTPSPYRGGLIIFIVFSFDILIKKIKIFEFSVKILLIISCLYSWLPKEHVGMLIIFLGNVHRNTLKFGSNTVMWFFHKYQDWNKGKDKKGKYVNSTPEYVVSQDLAQALHCSSSPKASVWGL